MVISYSVWCVCVLYVCFVLFFCFISILFTSIIFYNGKWTSELIMMMMMKNNRKVFRIFHEERIMGQTFFCFFVVVVEFLKKASCNYIFFVLFCSKMNVQNVHFVSICSKENQKKKIYIPKIGNLSIFLLSI